MKKHPLLTPFLLIVFAVCTTQCEKSVFENGKILEAEMEMIQPKRFEKILAITEQQEQASFSQQIELEAPSEKEENTHQGDVLLLGTALLMALATMAVHRRNKSKVDKMTRWAKANPLKAQCLIAALQLPLLGLGVMSGYNLKELGVEFSDAVPYLFGGLMTLGFLSVPFLPKRKTVAIPKQVFRQRLIYLGITLSSVMMTVGFGNKVVDKFPDSPVSRVIKKADQTIFSDTDTHKDEISKTKPAKKHHKFGKKWRQWFSAGSCALAVLLIILLIPVVCAGICMIIAGFAGAGSTVGSGILLVLGGLLVTFLASLGIVKVSKWC
jgi:hypothetical protein